MFAVSLLTPWIIAEVEVYFLTEEVVGGLYEVVAGEDVRHGVSGLRASGLLSQLRLVLGQNLQVIKKHSQPSSL